MNSPGFVRKQQSHSASLPLHLPFSTEGKSLRCLSSSTHLSEYLACVLHVRFEIQITMSIHNSVSIRTTTSHSIRLYVWCSQLRKMHSIKDILYPLAINITYELFSVQIAFFSNRKFLRQQVVYFSNDLWNIIPESRFKYKKKVCLNLPSGSTAALKTLYNRKEDHFPTGSTLSALQKYRPSFSIALISSLNSLPGI